VPADVVDRDLGEKATLRRIIEAEGMNVRAGILSSTRYPKSGRGKKGQVVAKVAAIHGLVKAFSDVFDRKRGDLAILLDNAHGRIMAGSTAAEALLPVAMMLRDSYRREADSRGLRKSGRLLQTIRGAVFDGSKRVAGDDHRRPRPTEQVSTKVKLGSASVFGYLR
jgi:hypothetical protein